MVLLDTYFNHLQARTGAEHFVIVRDDALKDSGLAMECMHDAEGLCKSEVTTPSPLQRSRSRRMFQSESLDLKPPRPPLRMNSQDDLRKPGMKRSHHQRKLNPTAPELSSRFKSLFGADMAPSMVSKSLAKLKCRKAELKSSASFDAPKFPIRKGSRDDLSTLQTSGVRLTCFSNPSSAANKKLVLTNFIDEVTSVIGESSDIARPPSSRSKSEGTTVGRFQIDYLD